MAAPGTDSRKKIMAAARTMVQAHGYAGLSVRDLASEVGIKAASIYHHFPSKADLAAAVAKKYWQDSEAELEAISNAMDARSSLKKYPSTFRRALQNSNRLCLSSFMATEYDDLPPEVLIEVHKFAEINIRWLKKNLHQIIEFDDQQCEARAQAIFAAIAGAQLIARSRSDIATYDAIIASYQTTGLLPA